MALHFVRDPQTRFRLALACGNIEAAMESAFSLEQQQGAEGKARDVWGELGSEALRQGNHQVSASLFRLCSANSFGIVAANTLFTHIFDAGGRDELPT